MRKAASSRGSAILRSRAAISPAATRMSGRLCLDSPRAAAKLLILFGWGTWTRTKTSGVRVRCSTIKLFPKSEGGLCASRPNQARRLSRKAGADAARLCCNFLAAARGVRTRNHNVKRPMASRPPRAAKKSLQWRGRALMTEAEQEGPFMPPVTIYTTPWCPYCARAKALLKRKGVDFEEIDASDSAVRQAMTRARAGGLHRPADFHRRFPRRRLRRPA